MESDWNITAPSAGHFERLRTQRLALSRALAAVVDRTMALSSWKGDYPIGAAAWANTEKNQVLGGPLNCSTLKELAVQGGGGQGGDSGHSNPSHGGSNNWNRGGGGGGSTTSTNPSVSLSQQVVITALQNGIIILYNTLNGNKSPLFVPSDLKTSGSSYNSGGHSSWAANSNNNNNNNAKDDKAANAIEQTIAANLQYGSLAAVAVAPVAYNKSDLATKVCLAWVLQDAIAVCQIDSAKRDPLVENLHKVAIIPTGLMPSGVILQFSNYFEWGLTSGAAGGGTNNSLPSNADPPARARMLASVVAESETATSRLSIVLQESDGATTFKPISSGMNNNNTWGLIHGEVIFAQWLANPKPSQQVLKAALLAERDNNADNNNNHHGGSGYTSRYRNYNNRGYNGNNNNYRRGGNYYNNRNNNYHNDDDQRRGGGDNYEGGGRGGGGNNTKRYEDYLPNGLQPEGGPALLLLGTSDCRLLLVQVYPIASTSSSSSSSNNKDKDSGSTLIPASNLAWRIVSETLIAHDSPTQHMACFTSSRSAAYGDSANVISMHAAMNVGGGGEEEKSETPSSSGGAAGTSATTSLSTSNNNKSLMAAALTTSVTTEYIVSYVSMGNVLQNATLEVTWPLLINANTNTNTFNASSSTSSQALGQKREREVDSRTDPRSGHSLPSSSISTSPVASTYPPQHLLHLQPLSSLSTDDYYIQTLSSGVFGHIPVFIIALSTGALIVLDGKSLTALHIFYFERNKHSTLTIPLALVPREQPPMIAVVDDENLTVVKERR